MVEEIELKRVAEIARLKLSEEEEASLRKDLEGILAYFSEINKIQGLEKEKELYYITGGENALREDEVREKLEAEDILSQFTRKDRRFLVAPKSLE